MSFSAQGRAAAAAADDDDDDDDDADADAAADDDDDDDGGGRNDGGGSRDDEDDDEDDDDMVLLSVRQGVGATERRRHGESRVMDPGALNLGALHQSNESTHCATRGDLAPCARGTITPLR
jgi:hypothetical protein